MARTEKEKMIAGEMYLAGDPELINERQAARKLTRIYNQTVETDDEQRVFLKSSFSEVQKRIFISSRRFDVTMGIISTLERISTQILIV